MLSNFSRCLRAAIDIFRTGHLSPVYFPVFLIWCMLKALTLILPLAWRNAAHGHTSIWISLHRAIEEEIIYLRKTSPSAFQPRRNSLDATDRCLDVVPFRESLHNSDRAGQNYTESSSENRNRGPLPQTRRTWFHRLRSAVYLDIYCIFTQVNSIFYHRLRNVQSVLKPILGHWLVQLFLGTNALLLTATILQWKLLITLETHFRLSDNFESYFSSELRILVMLFRIRLLLFFCYRASIFIVPTCLVGYVALFLYVVFCTFLF